MTKCKVWYCRRAVYSKGLCIDHYRQNKRNGAPIPDNEDFRNLLALIYDVKVLIESIFALADRSGICPVCGSSDMVLTHISHRELCALKRVYELVKEA